MPPQLRSGACSWRSPHRRASARLKWIDRQRYSQRRRLAQKRRRPSSAAGQQEFGLPKTPQLIRPISRACQWRRNRVPMSGPLRKNSSRHRPTAAEAGRHASRAVRACRRLALARLPRTLRTMHSIQNRRPMPLWTVTTIENQTVRQTPRMHPELSGCCPSRSWLWRINWIGSTALWHRPCWRWHWGSLDLNTSSDGTARLIHSGRFHWRER